MEFIYSLSLCQILIGIIFICILVFCLYALCTNFDVAKKFDRSFSTKAKSQIVWLLIIIGFTFVIMLVGAYILSINEHFDQDDKIFKNSELSLLEYVFALMLDPGQLDHLRSGSAHLGGLLLAFLGIITITGITISTISNMVQRRVNNYLNGEVRYKNFNNHYVIIGFNNLSLTIIEQLLNEYRNECRILLMSSEDVSEIRRTINTIIEKKYEKYITIYRGRKDTMEDIESLWIPKAKEVFLIGEKSELNRDASNVEALQKIVSSIKKYETKHKVKEKLRKIPVMVLFEYQTTYAAFQITDIAEEWKKNYIDFRPFNYYENWAKKLLYTRKYRDIDTENYMLDKDKIEIYYPRLDRIPITENSDQYVHLVIFSMSRMGVALGTFAAQVCHFPNFVTKGIKTRITFITPEADTEAYFFRGRYARFFEVAPSEHWDFMSKESMGKKYTEDPKYPDLKDMLDIEFKFIKGKAEQPEIRKLLSDWAEDNKQVLSIAICQRDPSKNMAIGLYLPDIIYKKSIPVFVRQKSSGALLTQLRSNSNKDSYNRFSNIYPFGMQDNCYDLESEEIVKAQLFNSFYYNVYDKEITKGDLMDVINSKWQKLKISHQWSNLYSVYSVKFKLNSLIEIKDESQPIDYEKYSSLLHCDKDEKCNFSKIGEKTELMAEVEHNRWNVEKLLLGYRVYTPDERKEDALALTALEKYMQEKEVSYADFEYFENNNIKNSHMQGYIKLKKLRKNNENTDFAHNAIRPYKELDESNKRYDRFMTGNIPEILRLYDKISDDKICDNGVVYSNGFTN